MEDIQRDVIPPGLQLTLLWQNLQHNLPFYAVLGACLYSLAWAGNRQFLTVVLTVVVVSFFSFWTSYMSTCVNCLPWYKQSDTLLTRCPVIKRILSTIESSPEQTTGFSVWSYGSQVLQAGGYLVLIKLLLNLANTKAILFWALLYPTVHNINYLYLKPLAHMEHHINPLTNYGMDIWDLIAGTKHDWSKLEIHNHAAINCVAITAFILWLWRT
jgi:hypothetical protein